MTLAYEVLQQMAITLWHTLPWLAGLGLVFAVLSRWSPCNQGRPWWHKSDLGNDLAYWLFVPIFSRYLRIWVTVAFTIWIFHIADGQKIADFYLHGHGPVAALPLWVQALAYLVLGDFAQYWLHRLFHRGFLWKYHAVHHAPTELDWISAARFHPVNLMLGSAGLDIAFLLAGISPDIFLVIGPFNIVTSCLVHANLDWTFGPLRTIFASPVFHRWHHASDVYNRNFASTFSAWDFLFGTAYMPKGVLPRAYGIDDPAMPRGLMPQLIYPLLQKA